MTTLTFHKMHGLGNDFIVIDATQTPFSLDSATIAKLGNRKTGIGFDQLLVVEPPSAPSVDFNYRIFNCDGSEVEHCGNGARCFAKFVIDQRLTDKHTLCVNIKKGPLYITYRNDDDIEVDMGKPILAPRDIPFNIDASAQNPAASYDIIIDGAPLPVSVLSMGNPHVVLFISNLWQQSIETLAKHIQQSDYFPESVNVNFIEILDKHTATQRTYERGAGETDACGTGVCAAVYAAQAVNAIDAINAPVCVKVRGGEIRIRIDQAGHIWMAGPARTVYHGTINLRHD